MIEDASKKEEGNIDSLSKTLFSAENSPASFPLLNFFLCTGHNEGEMLFFCCIQLLETSLPREVLEVSTQCFAKFVAILFYFIF